MPNPVSACHGALAGNDEEEHIEVRLDVRVHTPARRELDDIRIQLPSRFAQLPRDPGGHR
ncbi:hypothetical protein [Streptomyces cyaneus]|uniref:hypothetical protein n=1 Tax=Streptomyces cyaneus TaxID=1904 RepID=UPI003CCC84D8